jgi:DNA polymerase-4
LPLPTQIDAEILTAIRELFHASRPEKKVRLLGVSATSLQSPEPQLDLLATPQREKWEQLLHAADGLRDRYGESSVTLAGGFKGGFRERTHENPAALPGREAKKQK